MIKVRFGSLPEDRRLTVKIKGHAGAGAPGHDLVCAAASTLAYTIAQNLQDLEAAGKLAERPVIKLREGRTLISCKATEDGWPEALHLYLVVERGYQVLAHNYTGNITVR